MSVETRIDQVWQNSDLAKTFLEGVRGAIPLASVQIDCILRLIKLTQSQINYFLDLGCGNGVLGWAIAQQYPHAQGVFLDFSESMLEACRNNPQNQSENYQFIEQDFSQQNWINVLPVNNYFDVIVSGFAIHHQPDSRKQEIYQEIYQLLKPGGLFLNLEHIASLASFGESAFDQLFIDSLYNFHCQKGSLQSKEEIARTYYHRTDKQANILASVDIQCQWLREIGFVDVDCFLKIFEIALFGGLCPQEI